MVSALTCFLIAIVATFCAAGKGRTGWHWFAFSLAFFAGAWGISLAALFVSGVRMTFASEDRVLAAFTGIVSVGVMLVILFAVPQRPKRHRTSAAGKPGISSKS